MLRQLVVPSLDLDIPPVLSNHDFAAALDGATTARFLQELKRILKTHSAFWFRLSRLTELVACFLLD
ncbi:MAG: hypothetical protein HXX20_18805 [Chloroflexi bacterium]|nr:hypothetical protein [Chloroflexota bacterium]